MPTPTTSDMTLALGYLAASVAASPTFQDWTGTSNPTAAAAFFHNGEADEGAPAPLAIGWVKSWGYSHIGSGASDEFESNPGALMLQLLATVESTNRETAYVDMLTRAGGIAADLLAVSGQASFLACAMVQVKSVRRFEPSNAAARGSDIWIALIEVLVRP